MSPAESIRIKEAADLIRQGKLVAFPTETVYGLGANALDPLAVAKIFELKERPTFDPLIVHVADIGDIERLTTCRDDRAYRLFEAFWPGPLTVVLPKSELIGDIVTSGLDTVGIRMPANEIALALIREAGTPIAAPSANKFGRISPTSAHHVRKNLPGVDYILDGGSTSIGIESTIVTLSDAGFRIVRNGFITREDLEAVLPFDPSPEARSLVAPGMLKSHYSPRKPFYITGDPASKGVDKARSGFISFSGTLESGYAKVIRASERADLKEYAVSLFSAMHEMDESGVDSIVAEAVPETGIGIAIMDRLKKAAYASQKPEA